jgi:hypothetical protein
MSNSKFKTPSTSGKLVDPNAGQGESPLNNNLVQVELYLCNGKVFDDLITRTEARIIWTEILGHKIADLKTLELRRIPRRCLRINYQLTKGVNVVDLHVTPDFKVSFERSNYSGRILGFNNLEAAQRGEEVKVTILYAYPEVSTRKIALWLEVFGDIVGEPVFLKDADGIESGQVQFNLVIEHHIPEYLPIHGSKARVFYPGMPRQCGRCYRQGHLKTDCQNAKVNWYEYIRKLYDTGAYKREWFGTWIEQNDPSRRRRSPGDIASVEKKRRSGSPSRNDVRSRPGGNQQVNRGRRRSTDRRRSRDDADRRRGRDSRGKSSRRRSRTRSRSPRKANKRSRTRSRSRSSRRSRDHERSPKRSDRKVRRRSPSELDERDLRNRINDSDLRKEYQEFKQFQEMRKQAVKKNPYPDGGILDRQKKAGKRQAESRSGSPTSKKKREVFIVSDKLPVADRLGKRLNDEEEDSPWILKHLARNKKLAAKNKQNEDSD